MELIELEAKLKTEREIIEAEFLDFKKKTENELEIREALNVK